MITRENIVVEKNKKVRLVQAYLNQPITCIFHPIPGKLVWPIITYVRKSNEPIIRWNKTMLTALNAENATKSQLIG